MGLQKLNNLIDLQYLNIKVIFVLKSDIQKLKKAKMVHKKMHEWDFIFSFTVGSSWELTFPPGFVFYSSRP